LNLTPAEVPKKEKLQGTDVVGVEHSLSEQRQAVFARKPESSDDENLIGVGIRDDDDDDDDDEDDNQPSTTTQREKWKVSHVSLRFILLFFIVTIANIINQFYILFRIPRTFKSSGISMTTVSTIFQLAHQSRLIFLMMLIHLARIKETMSAPRTIYSDLQVNTSTLAILEMARSKVPRILNSGNMRVKRAKIISTM
jgi:hypothetical protein